MTPIDKIARYGFISVLWFAAFSVALGGFRSDMYTDITGIVVFVVAGAVSYYSAWRPSDPLDKLARYGFLSALWLGIALMAGYVMNNISYISLTMVMGIFSAVIATMGLFPHYDTKENTHAAASSEKRKNNYSLGARDLLTPDDLYLLRQEIKEELKDELRHQMLRDGAYDDDAEPLDALLDDRYVRTKRK